MNLNFKQVLIIIAVATLTLPYAVWLVSTATDNRPTKIIQIDIPTGVQF